MHRFYVFSGCLFVLLGLASTAYAQTKISGTIKDAEGEPLAGVNIIIKGRVIGTITDVDGNFNLAVNENPPMTMVVSFIGFATQEIQITDANTTGLTIKMEEQTLLGQEVVVSASRVEERIMESPVAIEKMDILAVQNTPADNYYKGLANLKGVDMTQSSINFQIINTRGFNSTGNTRFVQLTDGMDTQAPALNFPIGNLNGPSELDVESVELIPGASSALYGPNAFNGILLVNSKNAFEYQGLSAFVKTGVNHVGKKADFNGPSPIYEGAIRYAKAYNNKFAFKINGSYMRAEDWHGTDSTDREIARTPNGFGFNPGADRLHYQGDEASVNLGFLNFAAQNAYAFDGTPQDSPTLASVRAVFNGILGPSAGANGATVQDYLPFIPGQTVSRTPYKEVDLISYQAKNIKANIGLYYRLNDKVELSYLYNGGFGTSIYTGAQRYSLKNFGIQQHRLQLRGDNFYVRGYTTIENSGDSYITEFLGILINDQWTSNNEWFAKYTANYLDYFADPKNLGLTPQQIAALSPQQLLADQQAAHMYARGKADLLRYAPGSASFENSKKTFLNGGTIPTGPRFNDHTRLYHGEAQYDFKNNIKFMELQTGASYRVYDLRSNGTIFDDKTNPITITEYGAYVSGGKWLGDRKVKLSGSLRYDKNINFKGRINPRISGVIKLAENHNLRLSYQTGFRIPSTQGQHIDLNILSSRLLGGLPRYAEKYNIIRSSQTGQNLSFDGFAVQNYSQSVFAAGAKQSDIFDPNNVAKLTPFTWNPVKPEKVQNIEIGYKSLIDNRLLIDLNYYYNIYKDFITQVRVTIADQFTNDPSKSNTPGYTYTTNTALNGTPNYASLLNPSAVDIDSEGNVTGNTAQIYTNFTDQVTGQGFVAGLTYSLPRNYTIGGNYNWNVLIKKPDPAKFLTEYNTPQHKVNFTFGNRKVTDKMGFNVTYRWQSTFQWQSSFTIPANGDVPAYQTVDAQVTYKLTGLKSMLKIGGSNLTNHKYIQSLGGPNIGAIYYISLTFDELLN